MLSFEIQNHKTQPILCFMLAPQLLTTVFLYWLLASKLLATVFLC
jgi:hypothetical protein